MSKILSSIQERVRSTPLWLWMVMVLLAQLAMHIRWINDPPNGFHQWRQVHGYAFARNFAEESMDISQPRIDGRGAGTGIGGLEFPALYWLTAVGYRLFGVEFFVPRLLVLLLSFLTLLYCYKWAAEFFSSELIGKAATFLLLFHPLFGYYSFVLMSDVPMLGAVFASLYYFERWRKIQSTELLLYSSFALLLAGLLKVYALILLLYYAVVVFRSFRNRLPIASTIYFLSFLLTVVWYKHITNLNSLHANPDFPLPPPFPRDLAIITSTLKAMLFKWLPEVYTSYPQFALAIVGFIFVLRNRNDSKLRQFILLFGIGMLLFIGKTFERWRIHDYYFVLGIPLMLTLTLCGLRRMSQHASMQREQKYMQVILLVMLLMIPPVGAYRALSRFERGRESITPELRTLEQAIDQVIPDRNEKVLIGSDSSPCILLYFAHRKGWTFEQAPTVSSLQAFIHAGCRYMVSDVSGYEDQVGMGQYVAKIGKHGRYTIYRLKLPVERDMIRSIPLASR